MFKKNSEELELENTLYGRYLAKLKIAEREAELERRKAEIKQREAEVERRKAEIKLEKAEQELEMERREIEKVKLEKLNETKEKFISKVGDDFSYS